MRSVLIAKPFLLSLLVFSVLACADACAEVPSPSTGTDWRGYGRGSFVVPHQIGSLRLPPADYREVAL